MEDRNVTEQTTRANIISQEENLTELYRITDTLESRIVAEIPDILEIMENLDAIKDDWKERSVGINKSAKKITQSLDDFNDVKDDQAETGDVDTVKMHGPVALKSLCIVEGSPSEDIRI